VTLFPEPVEIIRRINAGFGFGGRMDVADRQ
jgi:hypothetical protein